jgi:hypothetical protein
MKRFTCILALAIACASLADPVNAQEVKKLAQAGLQFLKVDISPRAAAMGGAYTLAGNGASAMFSNPAGLALSESNLELFAGQIQWIADISFNAIGITKRLGNLGMVGFNFMNVDYGDDIIGTRVVRKTDTAAEIEAGFVETGNLTASSFATGASYARRLTDKFLVGGQVRYAYEHMGENEMPPDTGSGTGPIKKNIVNGLTYDFGTIFYPGFKSFRFGMSIRNFSTDYIYEEEGFSLPLTFRIGVAMDILDLVGDHGSPLLLAVDAIHPRDYSERLNIGIEYTLANTLALRAGYRFNYDEEGFSAGIGFARELAGIGLKFDYSYADFGVFDSVNRLAVGFAF